MLHLFTFFQLSPLLGESIYMKKKHIRNLKRNIMCVEMSGQKKEMLKDERKRRKRKLIKLVGSE